MGKQKSCDFLIQNGVDLKIKDKTGRTAEDISKLLEQKIDFISISSNRQFLDLRNEVSVERQQLDNMKAELSKQKKIVIALKATVKEKEIQFENAQKEIHDLKNNSTIKIESDFEKIKERFDCVIKVNNICFDDLNSVYLDLYNHLKNWKKNLVICKELDDQILHNQRFVNKEITNEELIKDISNQFYQHTLTNEFQQLINQQIKLKLNETLDFSQIPKIINDLLQKKIEKWKKNEENDSDLDKLVLTCKIDEKTILNEIKKKNDLFNSVRYALNEVEGAYGICVIYSDEPDKIIVAKKGSPLVLGIGDGENYIASDVNALIAYTSQIVYFQCI